jgi:Cd2+/Zn2+-exporting ATPase
MYPILLTFETNLKPEDKIKKIEEIKSQNTNKYVAMIGDGVNDAAALARSDIGFAMGAIGSDTAIDAADVALMHDDLMKIPESMILGKITNQIVFQNFMIWGLSNIIGLILVFGKVLGPTGAATYNFLTDFLPIFNALRIGVAKIKVT